MRERRWRTTFLATALAACVVFTMVPGAGASPGVSRRRIRIGFHAPFTGAVPLPSDSIEKAGRVFWRWLRVKEDPINRRHVRVVMRNDQTNPTTAVAACKEMVEERNVFMLVGTLQGGFTSQVEACARYAESVGVPYVSMGVNVERFRRFERYFAISKTHPAQARLVADLLADRLGARGERNAFVYSAATDTETIYAFRNAMERRDVTIHYSRAVPKNAGTADARLVVEEMRLAGIENVFFHHSPVFFLHVLRQADTQAFRPQWTGIDSGATRTDQVVSTACQGGTSIDGARFLSPLPAYADRDEFDPRHDRAMRRIYGSDGDTVTWLGWASSKALRRMLEKPGRRLTRARFEHAVERSRIRTRILPKIRFRPQNHFGGRGIHLLRADCSDRRWHTARRFVNDF